MKSEQWYELDNDNFFSFEDIPEEERLSPFKVLCGLMYLAKLCKPNKKYPYLISGAGHDVIYVDFGIDDLTEEQSIYLLRCGFHYSDESQSLARFV